MDNKIKQFREWLTAQMKRYALYISSPYGHGAYDAMYNALIIFNILFGEREKDNGKE